MKSHFYHLQININFSNVVFYKDLMGFLGWSVIFEMEGVIGFRSGEKGDIWFCESIKKEVGDYDKYGVNHIAIRVEKQTNIDEVVTFLKEKNIETLFGTPKHRPEFAAGPDETYYQVSFETPDKALFEVVYVGKK